MAGNFRPWNESVAYQVYPWTFNEDKERSPQRGIGSARGVVERLPYLQELGVDIIWISPHYASPMIDGGYDVADFRAIHPDFGTLKDELYLIEKAHEHNMRIMLDFVPNHTSDQHEWFQKSRRREEGFDDWYIWHDGKIDEHGNRDVPNNWASVFSIPNKVARANGLWPELGPDEPTPPISAWRFDELRGQYYLAEFAEQQPSLNWSKSEVREALKADMRFWLDNGVDGIRVDVANHIGKNMLFPDELTNPAYHEENEENPFDQLQKNESNSHIPRMRRYIKELADVLTEEKYKDRDVRMILEMYLGEETLRRTDEIAPNVASTFNFFTMRLGWEGEAVVHKLVTDRYYADRPVNFIGNQVTGNHDNSRLATILGDTRARAATVKKLFMPGIRFIYNGEELGFHDGDVPASRVKDPNGLRDGIRTPMIFNGLPSGGGFSDADPEAFLLPLNESDRELSYENQRDDPLSMFYLTVALIALAHKIPPHYIPMRTNNPDIFAYGRTEDVVVLTNFTSREQLVSVEASPFIVGRVVISSISVLQDSREVNLNQGVTLQPDEAVVVLRIEADDNAIV